MVDCLIDCMVDCLVDQSVNCLNDCTVDRTVHRSSDRLNDCMVDRTADRSVDRLNDTMVGRTVDRSGRGWPSPGLQGRLEVCALTPTGVHKPLWWCNPVGSIARPVYRNRSQTAGNQPFVWVFCHFFVRSTGKTRKTNETNRFFCFFQGLSGRVVWKTIRAGLPHLFAPIQSSRNQQLTNSFLFFYFVLICLTPRSMKIQLFPFLFYRTGLETMPTL